MVRSTPLQIYGNSGDFWAFYAQDDYRVTRNLTMNVGFRWELNSFLPGIRGQTNAFDFATGKLIVPTVNGTPDLTAQPGAAQTWDGISSFTGNQRSKRVFPGRSAIRTIAIRLPESVSPGGRSAATSG